MYLPPSWRIAVLVILGVGVPGSILAVEIRVPLDVPEIQQAISIANDGDVIIVSDGTWNEAIDFSGKNIEIRSENGPQSTHIVGTLDSAVVAIRSGETNLALLEGFTVRGGGGVEINGPRLGGGIYISGSSPRIRQCIIEENQASVGGGVFIDGGPSQQVVLEEVQIRSNVVSDSGGGLAIIGVGIGVSLVNCSVQENHAETVAGAIFCETSSLQLQSSQISQNSAEMLVGGVWLYQSSDGNFFDCEFSENNSLIVGGAVVVSDFSRVTMDHCILHDNSGGASGGGMLFDVGNDQLIQEIKFCVFNNNSASGAGSDVVISFNLVKVMMERCTFGSPAPNSASNIRVNNDYPEALLLDSCIVRGGTLPSIEAEPGSTVGYYSCVDGLVASGITAIDCIDEDPLFANPAAGILSLQPDSPCIDNGNPALPVDPDGSAPDMGALGVVESGTFRRGDVNADGLSNLADAIQILGMLFISGSGPIGCLDAGDCNDDGLLNISDGVTLLDALFVSGSPLPEPTGDCGSDPTTDPLDCSNFCP